MRIRIWTEKARQENGVPETRNSVENVEFFTAPKDRVLVRYKDQHTEWIVLKDFCSISES